MQVGSVDRGPGVSQNYGIHIVARIRTPSQQTFSVVITAVRSFAAVVTTIIVFIILWVVMLSLLHDLYFCTPRILGEIEEMFSKSGLEDNEN